MSDLDFKVKNGLVVNNNLLVASIPEAITAAQSYNKKINILLRIDACRETLPRAPTRQALRVIDHFNPNLNGEPPDLGGLGKTRNLIRMALESASTRFCNRSSRPEADPTIRNRNLPACIAHGGLARSRQRQPAVACRTPRPWARHGLAVQATSSSIARMRTPTSSTVPVPLTVRSKPFRV